MAELSANDFWLVASPLESNPREMLDELQAKLDPAVSVGDKRNNATLAGVGLPEFKTATLSQLLSLSEVLAKQDGVFLSVLGKIADQIKALDPDNYESNIRMDDGRNLEEYLLGHWAWDEAKYRAENRPLLEITDGFIKDMAGIDSIQKQKQGNYNLVKGQLQTLQRKQTGNLATRDLSTVVDKEDVPAALAESEFLELLYVAVPKSSAKEWENQYERLTQMVVPRSSVKLASDEDYHLYSVTVFKKVKDEFAQKCRELKFTVRDFTYDEAAIKKQQQELVELQESERDLWSELLRISRINYTEGVELLVHLKVLRAYVESLLRYGLPAAYFLCFLKPETKNTKKLLATLADYFKPFTPSSNRFKGQKGSSSQGDDLNLGEYATLLEAEVYDFVLFTVPSVDGLR